MIDLTTFWERLIHPRRFRCALARGEYIEITTKQGVTRRFGPGDVVSNEDFHDHEVVECDIKTAGRIRL